MRIIRPIVCITEYTVRMKQAPSLQKKIDVVHDLSNVKRFSKIKKEYNKMQAAKDLLKLRYEKS